jgi:hypothetical protein
MIHVIVIQLMWSPRLTIALITTWIHSLTIIDILNKNDHQTKADKYFMDYRAVVHLSIYKDIECEIMRLMK